MLFFFGVVREVSKIFEQKCENHSQQIIILTAIKCATINKLTVCCFFVIQTGFLRCMENTENRNIKPQLERPTLASRVPLFLLGHFQTKATF